MKKLLTIVAVALAAVAFTAPAAKAEAKVLSFKEAGEKLAKAEAKAYKTKKKVNVTIQVKGKKSKTYTTLEKLEIATGKAEVQCERFSYGRCGSMPSCGYDSVTEKIDSTRSGEGGFGTTGTLKVSGGTTTIKLSVNGASRRFREEYYENMCLKDNIADLREYLEDEKKEAEADGKEFNEKDKAWAVMGWCYAHGIYDGEVYKVADSDIKAGKFSGNCSMCSSFYNRYAHYVGVNAGSVQVLSKSRDGSGHDSNYVIVDGKKYILDFQDFEVDDVDYTFLTSDDGSEEWQLGAARLYLSQKKDGTYRGEATTMTRGEYCLLTPAQYYAEVGGIDKPSKWKYGKL